MVREINFAGATSSIKLDANGLLLEALTLEADGTCRRRSVHGGFASGSNFAAEE